MSPKSKEQYAEIRRRSSAAIKEAALELFAVNGYSGTSIHQVAKAAGVSKGLIYNYFDSKEDLLEAIIWDAIEVTEELMTTHLRAGEDPYQQLRGLTLASVQLVTSNLHYWKLMTSLTFQTGILRGMRSELQQKQEEAMAFLTEVFRQIGTPNPRQEMLLYTATLDGIMLHYMQLTELYDQMDAYPLLEMAERLLEKYKPNTAQLNKNRQ